MLKLQPADDQSGRARQAEVDRRGLLFYTKYIDAVTHAIQIVFLVAVPIAFVAFLLSFLLPEVELRKTVQTVDVGEVNGMPDPRSSLQEIELALDAAVRPGEPGRALPDPGPAGRASICRRGRCWLLYRLADQPACTVNDVAQRLKVDADLIQPGVDGLLAAGMIEERRRGAECDLYLTPAGTAALDKLTEARRAGLTELLEGWNPEEHPEIIDMVKDLAHSLLADDERLVADAMPHVAGRVVGRRRRRRCLPQRWRAGGRRSSGRRAGPSAGAVGAPGGARQGTPERRVLRIETDQCGTEHRRRTEADEDGAGCGRVDTGRHTGVEGGVGRLEDPTAEDDLDRLVLQVEPDDGGPDERGDLVGQDVGRLAGGRVAFGGGVEEDPGQLEQPVVGERAGVDAGRAPLRRRACRAAPAPARARWLLRPGRRRPAERGRGRAGRARRRPARSPRTVRPARGSALSGRRARPRRSSSPSRRRRRCPRAPSCPARETANVSLRRMTRSVHPSASIAGVSFSSSTGRSMPARQ